MARELATSFIGALVGGAIAIALGVMLNWSDGALGAAAILAGFAGMVLAEHINPPDRSSVRRRRA